MELTDMRSCLSDVRVTDYMTVLGCFGPTLFCFLYDCLAHDRYENCLVTASSLYWPGRRLCAYSGAATLSGT